MASIASLHIPAHVLFFNGVALVVFAFSFGQRDIQFGKAVFGNEQACGHNGEPFLFSGALQFAELLAVKEQFAVAFGVVGIPGTPPVLGNVHVLHIQLSPYKIAVAVHKGGFAGPYGFYLRTCKYNSCGIIVQELILKTGSAVFNLYFAFCFRHNGANVVKKTNFV